MNRLIINVAIFLAVIGLSAYVFSNIFIYVIISLVLATILSPITKLLGNFYFFGFQVPRSFSVFISFSLLIGILTLVVLVLAPLISEQFEVIASLDFIQVLEVLKKQIGQVEALLIEKQLVDKPQGFLYESFRKSAESSFAGIDVQSIVNSAIEYTGNIFIAFLAVAFITFFFLYDQGIVKRIIIKVIPNSYFELSATVINKIEKLLTNYLIGLIVQTLSIFTILSVGLSIMGIKYALVMAFVAAIVNIIPYVGPVIGSIFGLLVYISTNIQIIQNPNMWLILLKVYSVYFIAKVVDNILLQPLIFSKSVKAHPLEIFIAIFAGSALAGLWGMILAIPFYTILRVTVTEVAKAYQQYHVFAVFKKKTNL